VSRGALSLARAVSIALDIARALACAHDAGIVHRDVKPENIRVMPDGRAKLLDFGVARIVTPATATQESSSSRPRPTFSASPSSSSSSSSSDEAETAAGAVIGTARYMAPEQVEGKVADARADIFAFGIVFYEMLAGVWPWAPLVVAATTKTPATLTSLNPQAMAAAILRSAPNELPPLSVGAERERRRRHEACAMLIARCLEKDPARRFPDGAALLAAMPATLGQPPLSRAVRSLFVALSAIVALGTLTLAAFVMSGGPPLVDAGHVGSSERENRRRGPLARRPPRRHHRERPAGMASSSRPSLHRSGGSSRARIPRRRSRSRRMARRCSSPTSAARGCASTWRAGRPSSSLTTSTHRRGARRPHPPLGRRRGDDKERRRRQPCESRSGAGLSPVRARRAARRLQRRAERGCPRTGAARSVVASDALAMLRIVTIDDSQSTAFAWLDVHTSFTPTTSSIKTAGAAARRPGDQCRCRSLEPPRARATSTTKPSGTIA